MILTEKKKQNCQFHALMQQDGSAVVIAMLVLVVLTIMGISAVNLSTTESYIVRNLQIYQINFYHTEDGNLNEGYKVGHSDTDWYKLKNPSEFDQHLLPQDEDSYDPGDDMSATMSASLIFPIDLEKENPDTWPPKKWPRENLLNETSDDQYDYAYLVKYLYSDNPPKGFGSSSSIRAYKFRINSIREVEIETGIIKVGVNSGGF